MKPNIASYCTNQWSYVKYKLKWLAERSAPGILVNLVFFRLRMTRVSLSKDEFHPGLSLGVNLMGCPTKAEEDQRIHEIMKRRQQAHENDLARTS